jgi:hypothetical protein
VITHKWERQRSPCQQEPPASVLLLRVTPPSLSLLLSSLSVITS